MSPGKDNTFAIWFFIYQCRYHCEYPIVLEEATELFLLMGLLCVDPGPVEWPGFRRRVYRQKMHSSLLASLSPSLSVCLSVLN